MLILASQSETRRVMLQAAGVPFMALPAHVDERAIESSLAGQDPPAIALTLAEAKAHAISASHPARLVLGSDSLVTVEGRRFDKPRDRNEALEHLRFFSGKPMMLHSAAALVRDGRLLWSQADWARLNVLELTEAAIADYLDQEWPAVAACAGVFRIEGRGVRLFHAIEGDYFTILGMPLFKVLSALRDLGELA